MPATNITALAIRRLTSNVRNAENPHCSLLNDSSIIGKQWRGGRIHAASLTGCAVGKVALAVEGVRAWLW